MCSLQWGEGSLYLGLLNEQGDNCRPVFLPGEILYQKTGSTVGLA